MNEYTLEEIELLDQMLERWGHTRMIRQVTHNAVLKKSVEAFSEAMEVLDDSGYYPDKVRLGKKFVTYYAIVYTVPLDDIPLLIFPDDREYFSESVAVIAKWRLAVGH